MIARRSPLSLCTVTVCWWTFSITRNALPLDSTGESVLSSRGGANWGAGPLAGGATGSSSREGCSGPW
jgi:hypothetical protein